MFFICPTEATLRAQKVACYVGIKQKSEMALAALSIPNELLKRILRDGFLKVRCTVEGTHVLALTR